MKFNIFIPDIILKDFAYVFKKNFNVDCIWVKNKKFEYKKYNAIVVNGGFDCNKIFLKKFPNLKIISVFGVGYSGVDLDYCKKNKITKARLQRTGILGVSNAKFDNALLCHRTKFKHVMQAQKDI